MFNLNRPPPPTRDTFCRIVQQEIGSPGHLRIMEYHRSAFGPNGHFADTDKEKEWCGLFCLWGLHESGIALTVFWRSGGGFCEEQRLDKLGPNVPWAKTRLPEPGDIAYYDRPYRHHAVVTSVDPDAGTFTSCDGNQAANTVVLRTRIPLNKPTCFYSIDKLLQHDTEPSPPPTDAE
jgi:hypothetical protein